MTPFHHLLANNLVANITNYTVWFAITFWVYLETHSVFATGTIAGLYLVFTAAFGIFIAGKAKTIESFSYWQSGLLTPLFLVAGTFFPLEGLPRWAQVLGKLNPLYHCVQLVRDAVFGFELVDLVHLAVLVAFALVMWRLAIWRLERRLID